MTESDILGLWKAEKTITADGREKGAGLAKISIEFVEGGVAHVKILFLKFDAKWEIANDKLSVINAKDGSSFNVDFADGRLIMHNDDGSQAIMARA